MFAFNETRFAALIASLCALACVGCFSTPMEPDVDPAQVVIETRLPASTASPSRLVLTLVSSRRDTLQDTITRQGSRLSNRFAVLDPRPALNQTVITEYALAPGRRWTAHVRLLDARDSVRMQDSGSLGSLKAFERREAVLAPVPRFATCPARFVLPAARGARRLEFTRLQLLIDGKVARDTLAPADRPFAAGEAQAVSLTEDYLTQGTHQVAFRAYGRVQGEDAARLLYEGGRAVEAVAGQVANTQDITLDWRARAASTDVDASAGAASAPLEDLGADQVGLKVTLGRVSTVTLVATMSGAVDF